MVPQWITYQADVPFAQKLTVRNPNHNMSIRNMTEAQCTLNLKPLLKDLMHIFFTKVYQFGVLL